MEAGRQGADSCLLNLLAISFPCFVYLPHFTVVSHHLNKAMRSLFGDQGAEVSLGVKTETNQESLLGKRKWGDCTPHTGLVLGMLGEFSNTLNFPFFSIVAQLGQNLIGSVLLSVFSYFFKERRKIEKKSAFCRDN